jgi:hypothetical protein
MIDSQEDDLILQSSNSVDIQPGGNPTGDRLRAYYSSDEVILSWDDGENSNPAGIKSSYGGRMLQYRNAEGEWTNFDSIGPWTKDGNYIFAEDDGNDYVGIGDTSPEHKLDVNGNIGLYSNMYINWGDIDGSTGYGFRDNSGALEYKNDGGEWVTLDSLASTLWETSAYGTYENDANVIVGTDGDETINDYFALTGSDLFVAGGIGSEGSIYTDGYLYINTDADNTVDSSRIYFGKNSNKEFLGWDPAGVFFFSDDLYTNNSYIAEVDTRLTIEHDTITKSTGDPLNIVLGGADGDDLLVDTDTLMVDSYTNRVGVGLVDPISKMEISSDNPVSDGLVIQNTAGGDPVIAFQPQWGFTKFVMGVDNSLDDKFVIAAPGNDGYALTNPILSISDGTYNRVGINTLYASTSLHVLAGSPNYAGGEGIIIENNSIYDYNPVLGFRLSGVDKFVMGVDDVDGDKFKIGVTAPGANTRLTIDSTGNVGIGITTPSAKLSVLNTTTGDIAISGIKSEGASSGTIQNIAGSFYSTSSSSGDADVTLFGVYGEASQGTSTTGDQIAYGGYFTANGYGTLWGIYVASGDSYLANDVYIGGLTPTLSNNLILNGDDLFVAGSMGVEGDIYTDNNISLAANKYVNFGSTLGESGYGFRDNAGDMEYKDEGGSWGPISSGSGLWSLGSFATYRNDDVIVGADTADTTPLTNTNFLMNGNDLYVQGMLGVNSDVYTNGSFVAGSTLTMSNGSISQSTSGNGSLKIETVGGSVGAISVESYGSIYLRVDDSQGEYFQMSHDYLGAMSLAVTGSNTFKIYNDGSHINLQSATDSTTGVMISDADSGDPIMNVDTTNERVGINMNNPQASFSVNNDAIFNESGNNNDFRIEGLNQENLIFVDASADRVGFGNAVPDAILDIYSTAAADGIYIDNGATDGDAILAFQLSGTSQFTMGVDDGDATCIDCFKIYSGSGVGDSTEFVMTAAGSVGIGTNNPQAKLSVDGSAIFNESGNDADFRIESDSNANILFVDASANAVGIGTAVPAHTLSVSAANYTIDGTDGVFVDIQNGANTDGTMSGLRFSGGQYYKGGIFYMQQGSYNRGDLIFANSAVQDYHNVGYTDVKMIIQNDGDVGINNTDPDHTLSVGGNIGLSVSGYLNWGDIDGSSGYGIRSFSGTLQYKNDGGSWGALNQWTDGTYGIFSNTEGIIIGPDVTESLSNPGFSLGAGDLFVTGTIGSEGDIYTDGSFIAGSTLILNDSYIRDSGNINFQPNNDSANYLVLSSNATDLTLSTLDASDLYIKPADQLLLQSASDSTTAMQFLDADGGTPIMNIDATNERIGINMNNPQASFSVNQDAIFNESGGDYDFRIEGDNLASLFFVDASMDRIGIGTNSPDARLDVYSVGAEDGIFIDNNATDGDPILAFQLSGTSQFTMGVDDGDATCIDCFKLYSGNKVSDTSEFIMTAAGNIGLGTNDPQAKLSVDGAAIFNDFGSSIWDFRIESDTNPNMFFVDASANGVGIGTDTPYADFEVQSDSATATKAVITNSSTGDSILAFRLAGGGADPTFSLGVDNTDENFKIASGVGEFDNTVFTIKSTGNVGIGPGYVNPQATLTIGDNSAQDIFLVEDATISGPDATPFVIDQYGNVGVGDPSPDAKFDISYTSASDIFRVDDDGDGDTTPFLIDASGNVSVGGNVGIGTATPDRLLDIQSSSGGIMVLHFDDASIINGEVLGLMEFKGVDSGSYTEKIGAKIEARATGTWDGNEQYSAGTELNFFTQSNGATDTDNYPRLSIDSEGYVTLCDGACSTIDSTLGAGDLYIEGGNVEIDNIPTIGMSGNLYIDPDTGEIFRSTSSIKYKTNIADYNFDLSKIMELKPVTFEMNELSGKPGEKGFGFIAEDVYKIFPELTYYNNNTGEVYGVQYPLLSVILLKGYQEQQTQIEALIAQLNSADPTAAITPIKELIAEKWQIDENGVLISKLETDSKEMYAMSSTQVEFTLSGSAQLATGTYKVMFDDVDPSFNDTISGDVPMKIIVTPTGECQGVYVVEKEVQSIDGVNKYVSFTVKELNGGVSNATFDWIAIGRRLGYEGEITPVTPAEPTEPSTPTEPTTPTDPTPTDPAPTDPAPTDPAPTDPAPTDPAPTDPAPTDPAPTDPAPTDPAPTDPAPTDPAPTDPAPTDPAPTDPAPTDPAPTP